VILWHVRLGIVALAAVVAVAGGAAVVRGDDVVVEDQPGGQPVWRVAPHGGGVYDLGMQFDAQAFGGPTEIDESGLVVDVADNDEANPQRVEDALARRLAPAERRAAARITTVDRIVGLSAAQRKKLEVAAQSDLRRLADTVAEARAKYAGRKLKVDPRTGLDAAGQQEAQQANADGQRCRQLIRAAAGPESLLAKVTMSTLDEKQAEHYAAVMRARAACRWKAVVAAGLVQVDDQAGFTQQQHDAVTALLVADVPPADEESPTRAGMPAALSVARRLAALGDEQLAAILDPRQRQVVALFAAQEKVMDEGGMAVEGMGGGVF
jgi:hypothetical protein